jgi:hypothetical protein
MTAGPPRLKTEIWVQAFLRGNAAQGRFGAVIHKGAEEAGALYVVVSHLNGEHDLMGPPPGSAIDDRGERRFVNVLGRKASWPEIAERMARFKRNDPDLWLVEVEDRDGLAGLQQAEE